MPTDFTERPRWKPIEDLLIPDKLHPWWPWFCPRPTVRILFYTDNSGVTLDDSQDFGVNRLRDLILGHNTFYAAFVVDVVNRHAGGHAAHKLTSAVLAQYHQVWFFGVLQANLPSQPENELTDPEVTALRAWMDAGGGVLMTGDLPMKLVLPVVIPFHLPFPAWKHLPAAMT
jgi:hypothetical protein